LENFKRREEDIKKEVMSASDPEGKMMIGFLSDLLSMLFFPYQRRSRLSL